MESWPRKKIRSRPWLSMISNEVNGLKDYPCKLKISIRSYGRTKLGEKNNLPDKAVVKLQYRIDGCEDQFKVHQLEVSSPGSSSEPGKRHRKDIESVYLEEQSSLMKSSIDLNVSVCYIDDNSGLLPSDHTGELSSVTFEWVLQVKSAKSSDDGGSLIPSQEILLFISPESQCEKSNVVKKVEPLEYKVENIGSKQMKNANSYAVLMLRLTWKKKRNHGKVCSLSRRMKSRTAKRASLFPLTYHFRLSAMDDTKLQKYSLQCLWCNFSSASVDGLSLHYVMNHSDYYIQVYKLDSAIVFDVQLSTGIDGEKTFEQVNANSKKQIAEKQFFFKKDLNNQCSVMKSVPGEPVFIDINEFVDTEGDSEMGSVCGQNEFKHEKPESEELRLYYFSKTCTNVLSDVQIEDDSDEDSTHYAWQSEIAARQISEFVDVNEFEKRFTALWNKHRLIYIDVNGDCQIMTLLEAFLFEYQDFLIKENLISNFMLHLVNIYLNGCLPFKQFQQLLCATQFLQVTSKPSNVRSEDLKVEPEQQH